MSRDGTYKGNDDIILTVPLKPELHRRLRIHTARTGTTIKVTVIRMLETYLKDEG